MATRGRGYNQTQEWDPMREDYDNSNFNNDDETEMHELDHCRLYITNIPKGLNDDGLRAAFANYGTLQEVFVSRDPNKRYGLIAYETPAEARLAKMKLNGSEPLKFHIDIARKKRTYDTNKMKKRPRDEGSSRRERDRDDSSSKGSRTRERDDSSAVTPRYNRREELANGDNNILGDIGDIDDNMGLESFDPDIQLELEKLQLERLKLQQQQVMMKQKILMKQAAGRPRDITHSGTPSSRFVLPGGKVVVRQHAETSEQVDGDSCFTTGAGDSPAGSRACISCGAPAAAYCARCGVAPYCGQRCQRRDWAERHRDVCHNLARESDVTIKGVDPANIVPPPPQLRRPKSPAKREPIPKNEDEDRTDKMNKKFPSPSQNSDGQKPRYQRSNDRSFNNDKHERSFNNNDRSSDKGDRSFDKGDRSFDKSDRSFDKSRNFERRDRNDKYDRTGSQANRNVPGRRPPLRHEIKNDEENWGAKPSISREPTTPKTEEPKPSPKQDNVVPKPTPPKQDNMVQKPAPPKQDNMVQKPAPPKQEVKVPIASVDDVSPLKKFVPKNYLIETLSVGDELGVTVESSSTEGRVKSGLVCVHVHESAQENFEALLEPLAAACRLSKAVEPAIGDLFAYFEPTEEAWYRARRLSPTHAALIDSGKVVSVSVSHRTSELPTQYTEVAEFCCVLLSDAVKVGMSLQCTILSKTRLGYKVSITNMDDGAKLGEGEITRWIPEVELPKPVEKPKPVENGQAAIPEVPRPALVSGSKVFIVHAEAPDTIIVRGADPHLQTSFETALQLANGSGEPLEEPPQKGDTVVAKFTDGLKYRALVKRTNVKQKKYLVEYIEFGNTYKANQEDLYPCPPEISLANLPTASTVVKVPVKQFPLSEKSVDYLLTLRDNDVEVQVTSPNGSKLIQNGGEALLTLVKTNENLNRKLEQLSTPEWKKVEQATGNVADIETVMFSELEYLELPAEGCELEILDLESLMAQTVNGYQKGHAHAKLVFGELTRKMAEYCNSPLGKEPYMPKIEELCIAQCPPYEQWFRAVVVEARAGSPAQVLYIDYGNMGHLQAEHMRRITRDFVTGVPALATTIQIRGFPEQPTDEQLFKAIQHMQVNEEGRGVLRATRCQKQDDGIYTVDAPELIQAVME